MEVDNHLAMLLVALEKYGKSHIPCCQSTALFENLVPRKEEAELFPLEGVSAPEEVEEEE